MSSISETGRTRPQHRNETRAAVLFLLPFLLFYGLFLLVDWVAAIRCNHSPTRTGRNGKTTSASTWRRRRCSR